jgi:hypothetical protein
MIYLLKLHFPTSNSGRVFIQAQRVVPLSLSLSLPPTFYPSLPLPPSVSSSLSIYRIKNS